MEFVCAIYNFSLIHSFILFLNQIFILIAFPARIDLIFCSHADMSEHGVFALFAALYRNKMTYYVGSAVNFNDLNSPRLSLLFL